MKHALTGETPEETANKIVALLPLGEAIDMARFFKNNRDVEVVPGSKEDPEFWAAVEQVLAGKVLLQNHVPSGEWM